MNITWEADDGYCGGSAPQRTRIDDEDIANCETFEEAEKVIQDAIEDDFRNKVNWVCDVTKYKEQIQTLIDSRKREP